MSLRTPRCTSTTALIGLALKKEWKNQNWCEIILPTKLLILSEQTSEHDQVPELRQHLILKRSHPLENGLRLLHELYEEPKKQQQH